MWPINSFPSPALCGCHAKIGNILSEMSANTSTGREVSDSRASFNRALALCHTHTCHIHSLFSRIYSSSQLELEKFIWLLTVEVRKMCQTMCRILDRILAQPTDFAFSTLTRVLDTMKNLNVFVSGITVEWSHKHFSGKIVNLKKC